MIADRQARIQQALQQALKPTLCELVDESHLHIGHAGAQTGLSHYHLTISSSQLDTLNAIEQHRAIYQALGSLMQTDIHALRITVVPL